MALTRVQATGKVFNASLALTLAVPLATPPIVGNAIVVPLSLYTGFSTSYPPTCKDNYGNAYELAVYKIASTAFYAAVFVCYKVVATGASFTITLGGTGVTSYFVASAIEVSGGVGGLVVDRTVTNSGSSAAPTTGVTAALRTTSGEVFAVAVHTINSSQASITVESVSPTWTQEYEHLTFAQIVGEADTRILTGVTGTTQSCTWADTSATSWAAALVLLASAAALPVIEARETQAIVETLTHPTTISARVTQAIVETLQHPTPAARLTQFVVETLTWSTVLAGGNVVGSTIPSTAALFPPTVVRSGAPQTITGATCPATSTVFPPTLSLSVPARLTQLATEVFSGGSATLRATQLAVEYFTPIVIPTRVTQQAVEVFDGLSARARVSQEAVEIFLFLPPCTNGDFPIDPDD